LSQPSRTTNSVLIAETQIRVATAPTCPTDEIRGVKSISDSPHLSTADGVESPIRNSNRNRWPFGFCVWSMNSSQPFSLASIERKSKSLWPCWTRTSRLASTGSSA
jgi:hypothetical protein